MATSFTYATLVSALQTVTEDQGTEFLAYIPTAIQLAEDKLLRDLDLELFDVTYTSTFTASSPWVSKPSGIVGVRSFHYTDGSGNYVLMEPRSWEFVKDYWPKESTTTATPKYFTEYSADNWYIAGTPASGLAITARFIKRPTGLSSGNTTTWFSTNVGDLLLHACLASCEEFLKADARIAVWEKEYAVRLAAARRELKPETRADYMPITPVPTKE